jgi:hypothetical protein
MDGTLGNHLDGSEHPDGFLTDCRYATLAEIKQFARSKAVMDFLDL